MRPSRRPHPEQSAERGHVRRGRAERSVPVEPEAGLAHELQRDRLQHERAGEQPAAAQEHRPRRGRRPGTRVAEARPKTRARRAGDDHDRRPGRRVPSRAAAARARDSGPGSERRASTRPSATTRPVGIAIASAIRRRPRRAITLGLPRGGPRSSAAHRPAGSTRAPRRGRRRSRRRACARLRAAGRGPRRSVFGMHAVAPAGVEIDVGSGRGQRARPQRRACRAPRSGARAPALRPTVAGVWR